MTSNASVTAAIFFTILPKPPEIEFFALTVGATHLSPESPDFGDDWLFSFGGALGVKTYLSRNVGLRAQARLWMSTLSSDTDFWCTLPGGCVIVASNSTFFTQGEFSGGVMFVF